MEREQIIKALECCVKNECDKCPIFKEADYVDILAPNALALIKEQGEQIFKLENRLKECENGYEGTLYLKSCKLHDAEEKVKELAEENERLRAENARYEAENHAKFDKWLKLEEATKKRHEELFKEAKIVVRADTVREFAERLKGKINAIRKKRDMVMFPFAEAAISAIEQEIDQITKEMIGE